MNRILVWVLELVVRLAECLGVRRSLTIGEGFGRLWCALGGPRTRRVQRQLATALPELSRERREQIKRDVFSHLGRGLAEVVLLLGRHRVAMLDSMTLDGVEHFEAALESTGGRGAVVIGAHLGNWELAAAKLATLGLPFSLVYRGVKQPALERAIREIRNVREQDPANEFDRLDPIPMGARAGVDFVRALRSGRHVLVALDQHARSTEGLVVDFFGQPARTRHGPVKLAGRVGAQILFAFPRRDPDGRAHRLTIRPALQLEPGSADDDNVLRRNLERVTAQIESEIRASPEQWIWTHRRWRVAPDEEDPG